MSNKTPLSPYTHQILHIDLKTSKSWTESLPNDVYDLLIGGKGLGIYLLLRNPPKCDPFGSENQFIFVTGPLTGTLAPCANKFGIVTKGPASGAFLDAYSSGRFGARIKFAGYDAIVLHNQASDWQVVIIDDSAIKFESASALDILGKSPLETEQTLLAKFGEKFSCVSIGIAGERLSKLAGIFTEQRSAARGGGGAVLGSKKIKAVLVSGSHSIPVFNFDAFEKAAWRARRYIRSGEITVRAMPLEGTANIIDVVNEKGGFPTKNFQSGFFDECEKINGEAWRTNYWTSSKSISARIGALACAGCPISCGKISYSNNNTLYQKNPLPEAISSLKNQIVIDGPEYETVYALGPNILNADQETLLLANYLCDFYGIDTISTGAVIGMIMEMFERGIITAQDLDGIEAKWGDKTAILSLIRKMGTLEGCGKVIGNGVQAIAKQWPKGQPYAMHVKGLELPGYEPRGARGMGLCYAIGDRGACHLHAFTASYELMGSGGGFDPLDISTKKIELLLNVQADSNLSDCGVVCFFTYNGLQAKEIIQMLNAATGNNECLKGGFVHKLAKRVLTLTRFFNYREGLTMKDDFLPERFLSEAQKTPPNRPPIPNFDNVLLEYYRLMDWDEMGSPTLEGIRNLQIDKILTQNSSNN